MKSYPITIDGETFSIRSDGEAEHVEALVADLQSRYEAMVRLSKGPRNTQGLRVMTMVAMVLLDELVTLRARHDHMGSTALSFAKDISARIDEILSNGPQ